MLITHWKIEGHKKKVLKKDKFDIKINKLIISDLMRNKTLFGGLKTGSQ